MDAKKIVLLGAALLIAGISAFLVRGLIGQSAAPQAVAGVPAAEAPTGSQVLVAVNTLSVGTIVSAEMLKFQPWPKDMIENAYYLEGETKVEDLAGKVVRFSVAAGQPVPLRALVGPGESGFLAAALGPGMRAITVPINNTSGVGGFIFPGDRVDLVLTQRVQQNGFSDEGTVTGELNVAETIVRNVRVLAIDQRTDDTESTPNVGRTATFEVPPKMVERIAVAQSLGDISLSLRSLADNKAELDRAIAEGLIEVGDDQTALEDRAMELSVLAQPSASNPTYTTGGEVSRFAIDHRGSQRAAAPTAARLAPAAPMPNIVRVVRGNTVAAVELGTN